MSCVVVVHNYDAYIETAVRSALGQEGFGPDALEVIVVDDGSTDRTPAVLASFGDAITVLRQENSGPAVATTCAIARARGSFIALLDGDDEWLPDKLARQLALFERRPEVALVHGDLELVNGDGQVTHPSKYDWAGHLPVVGRTLGRQLSENEAITSTIVIRSEVAKRLPPPPAWAWCRDWWIAAQIAAGHEIDATRGPVGRYRVHGTNVSAFASGDRLAKLFHRDVRMQRVLLGGLDLARASHDEIAAALDRQSELVSHVSEARGIAPSEVLNVQPTDRLAAQALCERARKLLESDPGAAGRLAIKALAADPFDAAARELFESARLRPPAPDPDRTPSVAHLERLRDLGEMRDALVGTALDTSEERMPERDVVVRGLGELERARASVAAGAPLGIPMPEPTVTQRERSFAALSAAVDAAERGKPAIALARSAAALALDPANEHARVVYTRAQQALDGSSAPFSEREHAERIRLQSPAPALIRTARPFVAIADAEELSQRPALLDSWGEAFAPADPVTLAILSADSDLAAVHGRLTGALERAGLDPDGGHDLTLLHALPDSAEALAVARQAHALLTYAGQQDDHGCLAGHPRAAEPTALRELADRRFSYDGAGRSLAIAIKICTPRWDGAQVWGDTHFARALADELRRRGHRPRIDVVTDWHGRSEEWGDEAEAEDVVIHLRGLFPYVPHEGQVNVLWNISHPNLVTAAECDAFDLIATPSVRRAERLAEQTCRPIVVLEQATDPTVFFPQHDPAHARELVLVGNSRGIMRPILRDLLPTDHDLAVWGEQWERFVPASHIAGLHLPNDQVRLAYSSAAIVLNDHWDDMRAEGIVSNRIYDALACGALVLSDHMPELAERFGDAVVTYHTPEALRATVARLLADPDERRERAAAGRARVLAEHTFRHRIDALLDAVIALLGPAPIKDAAIVPINTSMSALDESAPASAPQELRRNAYVALESGSTEQAHAWLRQAISASIDLEGLNDLAVISHRLGRDEEAKTLLRATLALEPARTDAATNLVALEQLDAPEDWRGSDTLGGPEPGMYERAFPGMPRPDIISEHCSRYAFALNLVGGAHVLDLGCGTGYGSEMLSWSAASVRGFDLWRPAPHEHPSWPGVTKLNYGHDLCADPLPPADVAVMFEVIEHLPDAPVALEIAWRSVDRIIGSFPNPVHHGSWMNPYHVNDWTLEQFERELGSAAAAAGRGAIELTHYHQPLGSPLLVPGRDPEASYWLVVAEVIETDRARASASGAVALDTDAPTTIENAVAPAVSITPEMTIRDYWHARAHQHTADRYLGIKMSKFPEDLRVYEQLLWIAAPTVVVELGAQSGGSTLWLRDRLRTLAGYRADASAPLVISVDIDLSVARGNVAARDPRWAESIVLIEGDVCDPAVRAEVGRHVPPGARCLVIEDSAHVESTTAAALELYSDLVPVGGFFVVEDGCVDVEWMRISEDWPRGVLPALTNWLSTPQGAAFSVRRDLEVYGVSCHPLGFLERVAC